MSDPITPEVPNTPVEAPAEVTPEPNLDAPKPTETVDFWKQKAREQETRAKSNADAARRLQEIEESQKSEAQKQADATAKAIRDAEEAKAETLRYKVAATHKVGEDFFDLLGSGDEETLTGRAQRLSTLLEAQQENEQLKAQIAALQAGKPVPTPGRPVVALKPGASPQDAQTEGDLIYSSLFGE